MKFTDKNSLSTFFQKILSITKLKDENIVNVFFKRALFAMIFLVILSSTAIYFYQQNTFYDSLSNEIKLSANQKFKKYTKSLKLESLNMIEKDAKAFIQELRFITVEIYDENKEKVLDIYPNDKETNSKLELIYNHYKYLQHDFPKKKELHFEFFKLAENQYYLQIFYPLYKEDKLIGFLEGIEYIEPVVVNRFKNTIYTTIVTVVLTIIIFALLILPLIYFAYRKLNKTRLELLMRNVTTIHTLGNAVALRDSDTDEHNYRVTLYSIKLAETIKVEKKEIKKLIIGAFLHDIGKIGISDNILLKKGKLTEDEFEIMKEHIVKGMELIKDNDWLVLSEDVILYHHEKYDGSGYPYGAKGSEIPLIARIFSIADVFDALTSKRPYKDAYNYDKAIRILEDNRGKHFDADILDVFIKISKDFYADIQLKNKKLLSDELDTCIKKYFLN